MNSAIEKLAPYAFTALRQRKEALQAQGTVLLDFGVGDPQDPTPAFIRQALTAALKPESRYPTSAGLPELRQAIAGWFGRRFGVTLDPDVHVLPANGSKEALFNLGLALLDDPRRGPQAVGVPDLAYQVYADSARLHHAEVIPLPLDGDWLPDLNALTPDVLGRLRLLWLNYPNNPTGAVAPPSYYREVLALAEHWGFYVASDEAYSELWYDKPTAEPAANRGGAGYRHQHALQTQQYDRLSQRRDRWRRAGARHPPQRAPADGGGDSGVHPASGARCLGR